MILYPRVRFAAWNFAGHEKQECGKPRVDSFLHILEILQDMQILAANICTPESAGPGLALGNQISWG